MASSISLRRDASSGYAVTCVAVCESRRRSKNSRLPGTSYFPSAPWRAGGGEDDLAIRHDRGRVLPLLHGRSLDKLVQAGDKLTPDPVSRGGIAEVFFQPEWNAFVRSINEGPSHAERLQIDAEYGPCI